MGAVDRDSAVAVVIRGVLLVLLVLCPIVSSPAQTPAPTATSPAASPVAADPIPDSPGFHDLVFSGSLNGQPHQIGCNVFLPRKHAPGQTWPMIVYLVGVGDRGIKNGAVYNNGPTMSLKTDKGLADWAPFIVFTPQCPPDLRWDTPGATQLVAQAIRWAMESLPVDRERVYLTGLSMGGAATWRVAMEMPETFAAIAPICSIAVEPEKMADAVVGTSVCIICGAADGPYTAGSRSMYEALKLKHVDVAYAEIPGKGHGVWPPFYASRAFYEYLLLHQRGRKPTTRPMAEELVAIAYSEGNSADAALLPALRQFLPWWHISNCGRENSPGLKDDMLGRKGVFVTTPLAAEVPCRLMFTTDLAASGGAKLRMVVASHPEGAWELIVRANSVELMRKRVAGGGWQEFTVDLARFRGEQIHLELLNGAAGSPHPEAYWGEVELSKEH